MGWAAAGGMAAGAISAYMQSRAAGKASKRIAKAMEKALKFQKQVYAETKAETKPYVETGERALTAYNRLLFEGPDELLTDPAYQFGVGEGVKALERGAGARGKQLSGGQLKALTRFGQDYGLGYYGTRLGQFQTGVGIGQSAIAVRAGQGMGAATNVGNIQMQGGQNLASLRLAQAQPWANLLNRIGEGFSAYQGQQTTTTTNRQQGQAPRTITV